MAAITEHFDVVVVGAGHAGCEAALACARLNLETILYTVSVESIALMPCNPNIGGSSKGHLVRELDALGGEMGKVIDRTFIQSRMLNRSKGPAVHSLRAQADKAAYTMAMRHVVENQPHLTVRQQEVTEIMTTEDLNRNPDLADRYQNFIKDSDNKQNSIKNNKLFTETTIKDGRIVDNSPQIIGIRTISGAVCFAKAVILCTGVYLKARCIYGETSSATGPNGLLAANHLSDSLRAHGIRLVRFKTGTPARIDGRTIDFSKCERQDGDRPVIPFSFSTDPEDVQIEQQPCWLTYTNEETHRIIRDNIDRSPLYGGVIHATGPRYCPSIEDKVMKFPDKTRHQVFIEPEGSYTNEMYIDGMSSSMPEDVQFAMYRTVPGLEHAQIVRNAYAIEYDCLAPRQLRSSLEFRSIKGLFSGGQFNGSSGYEEAAAQGLMAGINASQYVHGRSPLVLLRSEAYIGVLIDDLVTKENFEPYRMMTSRAEYRLLLRQDNADLRLSAIGHEIGLVSDAHYEQVEADRAAIENEIQRLSAIKVGASAKVSAFLSEHGSTPLKTGESLAGLIRRPELDYESVAELDPERSAREPLPERVINQININIKYEGYITRQKKQVEQFRKLESKKLDPAFDYSQVKNLRIEARQKLNSYKPSSIGQATRIGGVSPADISVLLVYLEQKKLAEKNHSEE